MKAGKDAYARYRAIDERLRARNKPAPTLEDLIEYVSRKVGSEISTRSVQYDIQQMRYDKNLAYEAPIVYDRKTRRYKYSEDNYSIERLPLGEEDLAGLELAVGILEQFKELPALKQFEESIVRMRAAIVSSRQNDSGTVAQYLQLDRPPEYVGIAHLQTIVDAIKDCKCIIVHYKSFTSKQNREHKVQPYLVKEYKGRLYLLGMDLAPGKMPKMLLFAFDRITALRNTYDTFIREKLDVAAYFKHTIGVGYSTNSPEEVVLQFVNPHAAYVLSQPIHSSQKIIKTTETHTTVSVKLVLNTELKMKILEFGAGVTVLAPAELTIWAAKETKAMAKLYK